MRRPSWPLLPWLGGLLALYLAAPFVAGLAHVGLADWAAADWAGLGDATVVSLLSATVATLLVALGGIPLGYLLARRAGRGMALLGFMVQLPLALPPLASGILLLFLLGYASPLGQLTHGALTDSFTGIVLAEAFVAAPFLIIAARSSFAAVDPVLEDVAATLGLRPWQCFLRATLPLAWRGILAGMLLTWLRAFGEFGATVMVAYHPYSLPVFTYVAFGAQGLPAMLPVLLPTLVAAVAVMAVATLFTNGRARASRPAAPADADETAPAILPADRPPPPARPLAFAFRRELDGFTLDVAWQTTAHRLAILGASGSGKSLTLRAIAGLDWMQAATLTLGGKDLSLLAPERRGLAYVPQTYGLFPHLTVAEQLRFATGSDAGLARHWIDRLGLSGLQDRLPDTLSLGQRQRVALARAFSRPAPLLLLDEPFSALDAPLRAGLRRALRALQAEIEATTVLVTHDPEEAFLLADELLILDHGRVLQAGPVDTVFARPASEAVARLLGADNMAHGVMAAGNLIDAGAGLRIEVGGPALQTGARVGWAVRPDSIRIGEGGRYPGTILDMAAPVAGRCEVTLRLGGAKLRAAADAAIPLAPGPCAVSVSAAAVQLWML